MTDSTLTREAQILALAHEEIVRINAGYAGADVDQVLLLAQRVVELEAEKADWKRLANQSGEKHVSVASQLGDAIDRAEQAEATLQAIQALPEKWQSEARAIERFHATMGTGWKACAEEVAQLLHDGIQP